MDLDFATHLALTDLKARYFAHLDAKEWDRMRDLFTPDAVFEGYAFEAAGRDGFIATVSEFLADVRSHHQGFLPRYKVVAPGEVRAVWRMRDYLTWAPDSRVYKGIEVPGMCGIEGYGQYEDVYTLTPGGWRISFSRLARTRIDALTVPRITPDYHLTAPDGRWLT